MIRAPFIILLAGLAISQPLSAQKEVLKPEGSSWQFLMVGDELNNAVDPATLDGDFSTTWYQSSGYDGPAFATGNGYFGYGGITGAVINTNIWDPDGSKGEDRPESGSRYTAYFRTTITPTMSVSQLRFTGIIDDGAIIYLDGVELTRINMTNDPDTWTLLSDGSGSESTPVNLLVDAPLPAGVPVEVGVSVHNQSATSSDMGFDLRITSEELVLPPNDDFADGAVLTGTLPLDVTGWTDNRLGEVGATKESGEPDHAGNAGGASVWWRFTPATTGRYYVSLDGSDFDTLLAVYTGNAVGSLTAVSRFPNLSVPASSDDERFYRGSRVEFNAVAGTTYHIAVDGSGGAFGNVALRLGTSTLKLNPLAELLPAGSQWEYLLAVDGTNQPIDPETVDLDFDTTWHTDSLYNGPAFAGPAPALLGYGNISADPVVTDTWGGRDHNNDFIPDDEPPAGLRFTNYFRTTFTPAVAAQHLGFEGLIDDGAVIYIDGVEVARINFNDSRDATDWDERADGNADETAPQIAFALNQNLPAGVPVEIAVSVHNSSSSSSDLGFDLRVYSVVEPVFTVPANDDFADAAVLSGTLPLTASASTEDPVFGLGASKEPGEPFHAGKAGGGSVWWQWTPTVSRRVAISLAGSDFDTLLAVYTGGSVSTLVPVMRYPNLAVPASSDDEPFHEGSRVEFDVVAGTTYRIAVDGDQGSFGAVMLGVEVVTTRLNPVAELLPAESSWEYLLHVDGSNQPIDPDTDDSDFDSTWQTTGSYDGPAFSGPAAGLFGYGSITNGPVVTDIWGGRDHSGDGQPDELPPSEARLTTYYRTTFTPAVPVENLAFEGLIDDGAVVYLDGVEVARLNVDPTAAATWSTRALGNDVPKGPTEAGPQVAFALGRTLPAGQPVELAVSVHNSSSSSSDLAFDLRVYSVLPPDPFDLAIAPGAAAGQYDISWNGVFDGLYTVEFTPALEPADWQPVATGVAAALFTRTEISHTPGVPDGFYRVLQNR